MLTDWNYLNVSCNVGYLLVLTTEIALIRQSGDRVGHYAALNLDNDNCGLHSHLFLYK